MAAYVVFIREVTKDEQELKRYAELALPTLANHPVTPLAFYGALDVLEGPAFEGAVVLQFPSVSEARSWYDSPDYQAAALHRKQGSTYRVFVVEGSSPS
jgi:uncharacterized protein (DUF1330 family)